MPTQLLDPMDDAQMRRFHEIFYRAEREDGRPWTAMWSNEEMAGNFQEPSTENRNLDVATWDGDEMVGMGFVMMSLLDNLDTAFCFVAVEPELRGRGIGSATVEGLLHVARDEGRTQLVAGARIQRVLALPVDSALLDEIAAEAAPGHVEYEIRTFTGPIPEELIASYCDHLNTFALEAPSGEVEMVAINDRLGFKPVAVEPVFRRVLEG